MTLTQAPKPLAQSSIHIADQAIGEGQPVFIIAEVGINHNGCMNRAKRLIDAAVEAGASAVKFQKRNLQSIYQKKLLDDLSSCEQSFQYLMPILKDYELTIDQMLELKEYCDDAGIIFICTPFDRKSADQLDEIDVPAFKVSSADLTNFYLLDYLASLHKPLIVSTGMSIDIEIEKTFQFLQARSVDFALLHSVSSYPVDPRDANLGRITQLLRRYDVPIGYSSHDVGTILSVIATSLGSTIIEKHITLDKSLRGPEHKVSLLPDEFNHLVESIRETELASLKVNDYILQGELLNKMVFRKSVVAARPIKKGQRITEEMLTVKSPGTGLSGQQFYELIGATAKHDFEIDDLFHDSDLCDTQDGADLAIPDWGKWGFVVRYHDLETVLPHNPEILEFHFTYNDTL
ncbi:MAG: N-acetylneuraminate synthase family protein, partial [Bdellovibrionales bacterium]|nr:N-acetylneuraminate synthase family protein [Bdellovibrionales bacterium]